LQASIVANKAVVKKRSVSEWFLSSVASEYGHLVGHGSCGLLTVPGFDTVFISLFLDKAKMRMKYGCWVCWKNFKSAKENLW